MSLSLQFKGWFQARFATDEDAYDHPRGQKGWTFAFEGEPDFDRVIRFAAPVAPRSHGPAVGVTISGVSVDGAPSVGHVLVGAAVQLLDAPKFEGHNGDIAPDGREPVFPFHFKVSAGDATLEIREWLTFQDLFGPVSATRFGQGANFLTDQQLKDLIGTSDLMVFRSARKTALQNDLATEQDATRKKNLQQRIAQLNAATASDIQVFSLKFFVPYAFAIPAASRVVNDPKGKIGGGNLSHQDWKISWRMECWDADALCGFIGGRLDIG